MSGTLRLLLAETYMGVGLGPPAAGEQSSSSGYRNVGLKNFEFYIYTANTANAQVNSFFMWSFGGIFLREESR